MSSFKAVVLESPFSGETPADIESNTEYARRCLADSLSRGEAPLASHLLYTQPGVLDDSNADQRALGLAAGHHWIRHADSLVVYADRGISSGMRAGIKAAEALGVPIVYRQIGF